MRILLKKASICDPLSTHNGEVKDVFIEDGLFKEIGSNLEYNSEHTLDCEGKFLLPGFVDIGTGGGEPGNEHRETIKSLLNSAASGGFTDLFTLPNLHPITDSVSEVEYLLKKSAAAVTTLHPMGSVSISCNGNDISEMLDMHSAGVRCFTDGQEPIQLGGLLLRALLYTKAFDGLVLNQPYDKSIFTKGHIHEGPISTQLGLKGIPTKAEIIMLQRDLQLLEYTGGHLHVWNVSSAESVELIRQAKSKGLHVTASVPVWNLIFTDEVLTEFNPMFKLNPPLRTIDDLQALIQGLKGGIIDCITSGHTPLESEKKDLEFPFVSPGAISLQTAFSLAWLNLAADLTLEELVTLWSHHPAKITGIQQHKVEKDEPAAVTLFDPDLEWTFNEKNNQSKSQNSPLWGEKLKGAIVCTINNHHIFNN